MKPITYCQKLLKMGNFKEDIAKVKAFVFDVDGVFTNGSLTVTTSGDFARTYYARDGFAVVTALKKGYIVGIISGGKGESIEKRFRVMGIDPQNMYLGSHEKVAALNSFMDRNNLTVSDIMYVGDDIPDIAPMKLVAMPVCPQDADAEVVKVARYVSRFPGGRGCIRDVVEQVLRVHDNWHDAGEKNTPSV